MYKIKETDNRQKGFDLGLILPLLSLPVTVVTLALPTPYDMWGMVLNGVIFFFILLLSKDGTTATLPALCILLAGLLKIPHVEEVIPYIPYALILVAGFLLRLCWKGKKPVLGLTFYGACAFSLAVILGGVGYVTWEDYTDPTALYYCFGMALMPLLYLPYSAELSKQDGETALERFLHILSAMGVVCSVAVVIVFKKNYQLDEIHWWQSELQVYLAHFYSRNTVANLIVMSLPAQMYFLRSENPFSALLHFGLSLFSLGATFLSFSRNGWLWSAVLFAFCYLLFLFDKKVKIRRKLLFTIALTLGGVLVWHFYGDTIWEKVQARFKLWGADDDSTDNRLAQWSQALSDFKNNMLFGTGCLCGNTDDWALPGTLYWYHNLPLQVLGGYGIVGVVTRSALCVTRIIAFARNVNKKTTHLFLCHVGLVLFSLFDPGEFVPFPFYALATIIFAYLDRYNRYRRTQK